MNHSIKNTTGTLKVQLLSIKDSFPISNAVVSVFLTGIFDSPIKTAVTDSSGITPVIELETPPMAYSLDSSDALQPYTEYTIQVQADDYFPVTVAGVELFPEIMAIQTLKLTPLSNDSSTNLYVIPPHTLYGNYPAKIPESEIKPVSDSGEIVLSRVVIPEYIIVHDGSPRDSTAKDYYVRYRDYIKNVASSEIYATWPDAAIRANILAIMSFTLNRVYTEWYRNQGYSFTITSSTAYDHKWIPERNIYDTISLIVDELFADYLSRPNVRQPILTQYCDGRQVQCPNWMTQWGSKNLADQGYSTIEILRYYYGESIYINSAEEISGIPSSWPGYTLEPGSSGSKVLLLQEELNRISIAYPAIPSVSIDGIYGPETANSVKIFQSVFGLPETGTVDYRTWYKISEIYVGVSRIAELDS